MTKRTSRALLGVLALAMGAGALPAAAQDSNTELRLKKAEAEIRALQRKVFPGGDGTYFEPQISTAQPARTGVTTPSTTAVTDMLARLDALEAQIARLTSQTEENTNAIGKLNTRLAALEVTSGAAAAAEAAKPGAAAQENLAAMTGGASAKPAPTPAASKPAPAKPAGPTAERLAAVQAIAKPKTNDPGDDEYSYGFRLWDAGFYPEAEQQLSLFVEKYPKHARISYGRNLLGRAYLDDGKPKEAAPWFLKNYQADKNGERAPDSLLYLAEAMIAEKDTKRACIALAEFSETYPVVATGRLKSQYEADRKKVKCN
jgi:TolA-binding protein